ncbi:retron-type reverse transcriptase [Pedobacter glucosidilyticus]|nr:reverse transcriptase family protein [Pedobacter glucosidilyticus]KHJ37786.1 retron-type reverse transcriptase [Pedobacter glucosidilyticus]
MITIEEILTLSKTNKSELQKYFSGGSYHLDKSMESFQKHELNALYFLSIEEPKELTRFFKTSFFQLEEILNNPLYKNYTIKKKRGGARQICEPEKHLKSIQKRLNYFLQAYYLWIKPNEVHGFVVNPHYLGIHCNIVENAKVHVNKKDVLNIDLKDFFPSISAQQVKNIFSSNYFNFNEQISTALTLLTTYEGKLPIGAPTSPVISNFICHQLDNDLITFCKQNNLTFTRYADDLTFSSDNTISDDNTLNIFDLIKKNQFEINEKKVRLKRSHRKQTVTGLTVNSKVNVDRKLLKKIRAMLHDLVKNGIETSVKKHFNIGNIEQRHKVIFINRLKGYINFVGQVRGKNDSLYLKQKSTFNNILISSKGKSLEIDMKQA